MSAIVLKEYEKAHVLNENHRKQAVTATINYFLQKKIRLVPDDFNLLTDKLIEIFPSEDKVRYIIFDEILF